MSSFFRGLLIILIRASYSQENCTEPENTNIDTKSIDILRPDNDLNEQPLVDISASELNKSAEYSLEECLAESLLLNESIENFVEDSSFNLLEEMIQDSEYIKTETQAIENTPSIKSIIQTIEETFTDELNEHIIDDSPSDQIIEESKIPVIENKLFNESDTQAIEDKLLNESETQIMEDKLLNESETQIMEDYLPDQTSKEVLVDQPNLENKKSFALEALENRKTENSRDDLLSDPVAKDDSRSNESITEFGKNSFQNFIEDAHTILKDNCNDESENHTFTTVKKDSNNEISLQPIINNNKINNDINLSSISLEKDIKSKNRSPIERDINPKIRDDSFYDSLFQEIEFDKPKVNKKYPAKIKDYFSLNQTTITSNSLKDKKHNFLSEINTIKNDSLEEMDYLLKNDSLEEMNYLLKNDSLEEMDYLLSDKFKKDKFNNKFVKKDKFNNKFVKKDERKFTKKFDLENELEFIDMLVDNELIKNSKRQKFFNSFFKKSNLKKKKVNKAEKSHSISIASALIVFTLLYSV